MLASRRSTSLRVSGWLLIPLSIAVSGGCGGGGGGGGFLPANPTEVAINDLTTDQSGSVEISYVLTDSDQNKVDLIVEFSSDGTTFSEATEDTSAPSSEGLSKLATSKGGTSHVFVWDSQADLPGVNTNLAFVRVAVDEKNANPGATTNFILVNDPGEAIPPDVAASSATAISGASKDVISVTFSEEMRIESVEDPSSFTLLSAVDLCGNPLDLTGATFDYDPFTNTTHIRLAGSLAFGTTYDIQVETGAEDLAGNSLSAAQSSTGTVGGDNTPPVLVDAFFSSSTPDDVTPDAGEFLDLFFGEEVRDHCTNPFDGSDLVFDLLADSIGAGASIGVAPDAKAIRIVLGTAPSFTPGDSLVNVSAPSSNDAIFDLAGDKPDTPVSPDQDDLVVIRADDSLAPILDLVTLQGVPRILNGDGPAGGTLQVVQRGFTIDLTYHDQGPSLIDPSAITIENDRKITNSSGNDINAGSDLTPFLTELFADRDGASFRVPSNLTFPTGANQLTVTVQDNSGNASSPGMFDFNVVALSNGNRPFETNVNPSQVWFLDFDRDIDTLDLMYNEGSDTVTIVTARTESNPTLAPNGKPDFDELLFIHGLNNDGGTIFNVTGTGMDNNEFMRQLVIDGILEELEGFFPGVNIAFTADAPGSFPAGFFQVGYNSASHSRISVSAYSGGSGALGVALVDAQNDSQDDDTLFAGSTPDPGLDLGIFPGVLYDIEINASAASLFRLTFDPFVPERSNLAAPTEGPVGDQVNDKAILEDIAGTGPDVSGDDATRRDAILTAAGRISRLMAFVLAHESGHSMGLVENDPMPGGQYGNMPVFFPGSTNGHINLTTCGAPCDALYPTGVNVMTPSVSFVASLDENSRFNPLILAYFLEKALYD